VDKVLAYVLIDVTAIIQFEGSWKNFDAYAFSTFRIAYPITASSGLASGTVGAEVLSKG
jgi:hypothetical protein